MNCFICGQEIIKPKLEAVVIYSKLVCFECAKVHGIKCEWCGEWGLRGDDDFPSTMYGQTAIHRKCMDHRAAFEKRKR